MNNIYTFENAKEALESQSEIALRTKGTSMLPMLKEGRDIVIISKADRKFKKNDVPLYKKQGFDRFVLHRIIDITDNAYIIRGDNLFVKETQVKDEDIIGILKGFYRNGKYYDCEKSKKYKIYVFINRISYPLRYLYSVKIRPLLSKIKRKILK